MNFSRPIVPVIVSQHLEDAAALRSMRAVLVRAPHVELHRLARTDERLLAHLDGLAVAGDDGARMSLAALESPGVGQIFVAAVIAIERGDSAQIERLLALTEALPDDAPRALASAFGWVSAPLLRGLTAGLLGAEEPMHRWLGIAACALHRVDPGAALAGAIGQPHTMLRTRALQLAGELRRTDLLPACLAHLGDKDAACSFAASRAAVLLGDRDAALKVLRELATRAGPFQHAALALALFSADPDAARALVKQLAAQQAPLRTLLKAAAWAGDVQVVPWIVKHMADDKHARLAGEAFSFITGADLALLDLERKPPERVQGGPTEDPEDDDVALDEDDSLPWPDPAKVQGWWQQHAAAMHGGPRCFAGAAPDGAHCLSVLRLHPQRRRIAAALHLSLANPGSVLFNCAAPSHRQQRLLAVPAAAA